jgi:hypothetical protein
MGIHKDVIIRKNQHRFKVNSYGLVWEIVGSSSEPGNKPSSSVATRTFLGYLWNYELLNN